MIKKDVWLLGLLLGLGLAATDVYVSILPKLVDLYNVSLYQMNLTLTIYFIMMAVGMLVYLNLSKRLSSEKIYILSVLVFIVGTMIISFNDNFFYILIGRAVQGLGFGLIQNNIINFIRQRDPKGLARNLSIITQSCELLCFISPLLGVLLFEKGNWNTPFLFIIALASFLLFVTRRIFQEDRMLIQCTDNTSLRVNLTTIFHQNFAVYLLICILMNATAWALISISPYYLEGKSFTEGGHACFYTVFSGFYLSGSCCFEKISEYNRDKFQTYVISGMLMIGMGLIGSIILDSSYVFMGSIWGFGFLSGLLYGFVVARAQDNISEKEEGARKLATTILLVSRLVGSGILTALVSWLYKQDQGLSIMFAGGLVIFTSYLLFIGKRELKLTFATEKA